MLTHPEKFTKVTGTIRQMQPDLTTDPDDKPGTVGITADLLFTPLVGTGDLFHLPMLPSPTDPETFAPELRAPKPIQAKLVDGAVLTIDHKALSRSLQTSQDAFVRNAPYVDFRGRSADEISPPSFRIEGRN